MRTVRLVSILVVLTLVSIGCTNTEQPDGVSFLEEQGFHSVQFIDERSVDIKGQVAEDLIYAARAISLDASKHVDQKARVFVYSGIDNDDDPSKKAKVRISLFYVDNRLIGAWKVGPKTIDQVFPLNIPVTCC